MLSNLILGRNLTYNLHSYLKQRKGKNKNPSLDTFKEREKTKFILKAYSEGQNRQNKCTGLLQIVYRHKKTPVSHKPMHAERKLSPPSLRHETCEVFELQRKESPQQFPWRTSHRAKSMRRMYVTFR